MTKWIACGAARTAYHVIGNGPALLLMHGAEANRNSFAALASYLSDRFTVIAYDQRDCGETEAPERAATLAELADDAHALICALGFKRAHVFGSSFGGRVAQALAAQHPESVERLVLGSTWPLPCDLIELNPLGIARLQSLRSRLPETAEELAGLFFPEPFLQKRPELRRIFSLVEAANARTQRRQAAVDCILCIDWSQIKMPVLLIAGELDQIVPPSVTLGIAGHLVHAEQILLPGIGHATAMQAPEAVAANLFRFLTAAQTTH